MSQKSEMPAQKWLPWKLQNQNIYRIGGLVNTACIHTPHEEKSTGWAAGLMSDSHVGISVSVILIKFANLAKSLVGWNSLDIGQIHCNFDLSEMIWCIINKLFSMTSTKIQPNWSMVERGREVREAFNKI